MMEAVELPNLINANHQASELLKYMLDKHISLVEPILTPTSNLGYAFPNIENDMHLTTEEVVKILELLSTDSVLEKKVFTNLQLCPYCESTKLKASMGCPQCGSEKIARGRILEHFACGNLNLEDAYIVNGKYVCPKCHKDVQFLGKDYMSIGVKYRCESCEHIFEKPALLKQCLSCSKIFFESNAREINIHSYHLGPDRKARLVFNFGLKLQLIEFLKKRGYSVTENARVTGPSKSGAEHVFDLLACKFDGLIDYTMCIDAIINADNTDIELDDIFRFDNKAYDLGIHDKVLIAIPGLNDRARKYSEKQRIVVFKATELENALITSSIAVVTIVSPKPVKFNNRNEVTAFLSLNGYDVRENIKIRGRSGVEHKIDIYATLNDGIIQHSVDIGILTGDKEIDINAVVLFDTRAFDIRAHEKVLLVSPGLDTESSLFAKFQGIRVLKLGK
jgi:hypothetical protein